MRRIGIVTAARSDYGIYRPVLNAIDAAPDLDLLIYVTGMHLSPEFGLTITEIEADGFRVHERIDTLLSSDTPASISKAMGLGQIGFAQVFQRQKPDLLIVLGDRFEMHAAGLAALPFKIPVAHIHGGEITEGAFDDALRHSLTKLSHLHFVATETYGRRIIQLGEESWRVAVTGSPTLDRIRTSVLPGKDELARRFGLVLEPAPLLVTFHPVTLEYELKAHAVCAALVHHYSKLGEFDDTPSVADGLQHALIRPVVRVLRAVRNFAVLHDPHRQHVGGRRVDPGVQVQDVLHCRCTGGNLGYPPQALFGQLSLP